jgi:hypothetical protein
VDIQESLSVAFKVIADPRVLFISIAVLLVWAALRYVGSVYHRKPRTRARPPIAPASPGAARPSPRPEAEAEDSGEGMVE